MFSISNQGRRREDAARRCQDSSTRAFGLRLGRHQVPPPHGEHWGEQGRGGQQAAAGPVSRMIISMFMLTRSLLRIFHPMRYTGNNNLCNNPMNGFFDSSPRSGQMSGGVGSGGWLHCPCTVHWRPLMEKQATHSQVRSVIRC